MQSGKEHSDAGRQAGAGEMAEMGMLMQVIIKYQTKAKRRKQG